MDQTRRYICFCCGMGHIFLPKYAMRKINPYVNLFDLFTYPFILKAEPKLIGNFGWTAINLIVF